MNKENCALKLVDEIILYYDARSKKTSNYIEKNCASSWSFTKNRNSKHGKKNIKIN